MEQIVTLGKKRRSYKLLAKPSDALAACQHLIDAVESADIVWPGSNDCTVMTTFANAIVDCVHTGLNIAKDEEGQGAYSALEVARKLLLFVSDSMPDAFDRCKMDDTLSWTADEGGHADALKSLRGHEVPKTFGLQPVTISCWTS